MTDVLPLAALVEAVPDLVRGGVKGNLEGEGTDEDRRQEHSVPPEEGLVDDGRDSSRHCDRCVGDETGEKRGVVRGTLYSLVECRGWKFGVALPAQREKHRSRESPER